MTEEIDFKKILSEDIALDVVDITLSSLIDQKGLLKK